MQNLIEQLKAHSLTKYIRFNKENEQFKLYLKQPYQDLVVWKDNPNESSVITISIHSNPKHVEKQLTHLKRMIDQERLHLYDGLTDLYKLILEKRRAKEHYEKLLTVLEQVRDDDQSNPWFLIFAQNQIYSLTQQLNITDTEAHILKGISGHRYRSNIVNPMCDPLLTKHHTFHKISVDKTKLNRFIQFVKNEIAEIEQYTK